MSEEPKPKSHVLVWLVAIFLALPVLYLLSVPPVYCIACYSRSGTYREEPEWVKAYRDPSDWLFEDARGTKAFDMWADYWTWWQERMDK